MSEDMVDYLGRPPGERLEEGAPFVEWEEAEPEPDDERTELERLGVDFEVHEGEPE